MTESVDRILELDVERRAFQKNLDDTLAESNNLSRQIGGLMREGKKEEAFTNGHLYRRPNRNPHLKQARAHAQHG